MEHKMKKILVCGAGGFIGYHLVKDLKKQPKAAALCSDRFRRILCL